VLRNDLKITLGGLGLAILLTGCSTHRYLIDNGNGASASAATRILIIKTDNPYYEYRLQEIVRRNLYPVIERIEGRRHVAQAPSCTRRTAQDEQRIDEPANFRGLGIEMYGANLKNLKIIIKLTDYEHPAAFSEKEILKQHKRISANIEIYDQREELIATKEVDTFSMYDVSDEFPYAENITKRETTDAMLIDLGQAISLAVMEMVGHRKNWPKAASEPNF
jgi:hypothetical protein